MDWKPWIVIGLVVILFIAWKRVGLVSTSKAKELLARGAKVVDVRSTSEFDSGHLKAAVNIPLGDLKATLPGLIPDKEQPLLLYCLSGGRSALGKRVLVSMGYRNVYNLGSHGRARSIVEVN